MRRTGPDHVPAPASPRSLLRIRGSLPADLVTPHIRRTVAHVPSGRYRGGGRESWRSHHPWVRLS